jgi:hypothetical protein
MNNSLNNSDPSGKSPAAAAVATDLIFGGPENPIGDVAAAAVYVGSAAWAAYELNQSMHSEQPCDREKQCEAQLERDYEMCDALARATQKGKRSSDAYARCIASAHQRHANCLRGRDFGTLDTWNN